MKQKMNFFWIAGIVFSLSTTLFSQNESVESFEARRDAYLARNGVGNEHCGQTIWAWLENNDQSKAATIHDIIQQWGTSNAWGDWGDYCMPWRTGADWTCVFLLRILYQYPDRISTEDYDFLTDLFHDTMRDKYFFRVGDPYQALNINNGAMAYTARYLHSQYEKDLTVTFGLADADELDTFTYNGNTYVAGTKVNSFAIARDWLYLFFEKLLTEGDRELQSCYARAFIISLQALYDFAEDPVMKQKAKMMLDFVLLESIIEVSGTLQGGLPGRTYGHLILDGQPKIYQYIYWGIGEVDPSSIMGQYYDAYVSTYRLPELIYDIGILDDESDSYYHMTRMNNRTDFLPAKEGKWNYVTKRYNLGGANRGWMMNVKSDDYDGEGIRFWINGDDSIGETGWGETVTEENYIDLGKLGFQYKNAMLIRLDYSYIHFALTGNTFNSDETVSGWRFLKENKVVVAIRLKQYIGGLEVCTIGVDYASYDEFKSAVINNAYLGTKGDFHTSRGDVITLQIGSSPDYLYYTYVNGELYTDFPFPRIECIDNSGNKIIQWNNRVMTVKKHGTTAVYDFINWTYVTGSDVEPPDAPQGVTVTPKE